MSQEKKNPEFDKVIVELKKYFEDDNKQNTDCWDCWGKI
jgi:hypothetical protein